MDAVGSLDWVSVDEKMKLWEKPTISLGEPPDPRIIEQDVVSKPLQARIVMDWTQSHRAQYTIDQCLKIDAPSQIFRLVMVKAWMKEMKKYLVMNAITQLVALGSLALPGPLKIIGVVIAISSNVFASYRFIKAHQQCLSWGHLPYKEMIQSRTQAYLDPFPALYAKRLEWTPSHRTGVLHRNEVEYLYKKYLAQFCRALLNEQPSTPEERKTWMNYFRAFNPLSRPMMEYGLGKIPSTFEGLAQDYARLSSKSAPYEEARLLLEQAQAL